MLEYSTTTVWGSKPMDVFEKSKWIWVSDGECADSYAEFRDTVTYRGGQVAFNISCDTDYTLYVNGEYAASNQYGDFEYYKIYDALDITKHLKMGENRIDVLVYYCGVDNSRYRKAKAGLIYEILSDGQVLSYSSERTRSRLSPSYVNGNCVFVSCQLGFTFEYDATKNTDVDYAPSVPVAKTCKFFPRPVKKAMHMGKHAIKEILGDSDTHFLIDLGEEVVGLPTLDIVSDTEQKITVAWGEHIEDGCVRKTIGDRNFYYSYIAHKGQNIFTNYMLRLGGRYLEVFSENAIKINYVGILPQVMETEETPFRIADAKDRAIYEICVNTLRLCMMEHYVDCPWREQALYAFDSRNQMLCGYYAFKNGNSEYARANLKLIGEDRREGGLLSICYPCGTPLAIPSFSLYYIMAMKEYIEHTGDITLAAEYMDKMKGILDAFSANTREGLVYPFEGAGMWNFYDWSEFSQGGSEGCADLAINCLFVIALHCFQTICASVSAEYPYEGIAEKLRERIKDVFFDTERQVFTMRAGQAQYTSLGNSLAILAEVVTGEDAKALCENLVGGTLTESSLSMKILMYQALMNTDTEKYREYILSEIRTNYTKMLDAGATTVWETIDGASAFQGAGSLCHGWSAVPVYIYHKLL